MWNNAEKFKIEALSCPSVYSTGGPDYKLDLDTLDDLARLQKVVDSADDIMLLGHVLLTRAVSVDATSIP